MQHVLNVVKICIQDQRINLRQRSNVESQGCSNCSHVRALIRFKVPIGGRFGGAPRAHLRPNEATPAQRGPHSRLLLFLRRRVRAPHNTLVNAPGITSRFFASARSETNVRAP
jgi:hypothetical protein